ncbi:MAG TPA: hypothetical protein VJA21_03230 [Verrucomicrobiae bacterium]
MTKWILRLALLTALATGGLWAWRHLFPGPEQIIRQRLSQIAATASTSGDEGIIPKAARVQKLTTFFTPDVQITIEVPGLITQEISGIDELTQLAAASRSMGQAIRVELIDVSVTLAPDKLSADAHMTGKATWPGERTPQVQELKAHLRKVDGQWLIDRAETVRTLR